MKGRVISLCLTALCVVANAQVAVESPSDKADATQLEALSKKIDEQNAKIDTLSQQIQKLEQSLTGTKPVVAATDTPAPSAPAVPAASAVAVNDLAHLPPGSGHTVARGETLTSIAKMHKVTIEELQKTNHITDDRKLQIGQTLVIPVPSGASGSPTPSPAATPRS
jgi:LysM repeat protein